MDSYRVVYQVVQHRSAVIEAVSVAEAEIIAEGMGGDEFTEDEEERWTLLDETELVREGD